LQDTLAVLVARPSMSASQWTRAQLPEGGHGSHSAWFALVAADVLARLDGYDGPLPEPPEPVVPEAPVTGPPTIAADLAPRTKAGDT
jgi:hypothetical protein